jgi:hypothetical protein
MARIDIDRIRSLVAGDASDSRGCMEEIAKLLGLDTEATEEQILEALKGRLDAKSIAKALDLKDDATEQEILDAIKAKGETEDEETSLEDRAKAEGKVVVKEDTLRDLTAKADRGVEAADKLHQREFDDAFEKALTDPKGARVDAKDETREKYQKLYDKAPEETIEILDSLPPLVNGKPNGSGGDAPGSGDLPDNVDEDRAALNRKVEARMRADKVEYGEALELVLADEDAA